ncbi:trt7 [Symbiodinium pilosum]|uniref:Trt7 protein n=1 Tax=Symbiodinium pilosum TaxID=2952 RepID=A0A812Y8C6_SYMPI|nr:trt7 [Symbiodinium pilosum]
MTPDDIKLSADNCIGHLEQHGCGLVRDVLSPDLCKRLQALVDDHLEAAQSAISAESDADRRQNLLQQHFGTVRDRQHRWDLKLPLSETVEEAVRQAVQALRCLLYGTVQADGVLVELSCLITDPGAPRQNVHVDTGGWKTACAPLLTVFIALQDISPEMGPTILFPGTHDDPYLQQWLSIMPGAERSPEQFGGGQHATCQQGSAVLMNSRLLHCGGSNLPAESGGSRRRLFYMTWQKPGNTNHGSTYTIRDDLVGKFRALDFLSHPLRCSLTAKEDRIGLEVLAKRKDDIQAMLEFAICLRREEDPGAVEWLRATGRKGHPLACMHLAEMYCLGELGLETNYDAADELRKFALGIFDHLADRSDSKPSFQEFLDKHAGVFRQDLLF